MKNFAKLILSYCSLFILFFLAAVLIKYLGAWIEMARVAPPGAGPGAAASDLAWKALPAAVYLATLCALNYAARRRAPIAITIMCLLILGFLLTAGGAVGISRSSSMKFALKPFSVIESRPGLILTQSDISIILLKGSDEPRGPRVVSIPGRPLVYQESPAGPNNSILSLPALPFGEKSPWFIRSVDLDLSLCANEMRLRLENSFPSFAIYVFSLLLLLCSLSYLINLSQWPLANIFIGMVIFRLVLALEIFLNTPEINSLLSSFFATPEKGGRFPPMLITPIIFTALGILLIFYTLLTRLAQFRRDDDD